MLSVLEKWPLYRWGWDVLIDWIEEDEDDDLAARAIGKVPPPLLDDPEFHVRVLVMKGRCGTEPEELDPHWYGRLRGGVRLLPHPDPELRWEVLVR